MGSLPLRLRGLECDHDAPNSEPKLSRSLSMSLDPLPCTAIGSHLFLSGISAPLAGATSAPLALLALVPIVPHEVLGGSGFANERRVGTC